MKATAIAFVFVALFGATVAQADTEDNLGGPGESCRARPDCKHGLKCLANVCTDEHEGITCGATAECGTLKCIENKCVNPLKLPTHPQPTQPQPTHPQPTQPQPTQPQPTQPQPTQPQPTQPQPTQPQPTTTQPQETQPQPTPTTTEPIGGGQAPETDPIEKWLKFDRTGMHPFIGITLALGLLNGGYTASEGSLWGTGADSAFLLAIRGGVLIDHHEISLEIAPGTYFWDFSEPGAGPAFELNASYAYRIPLLVRERGAIMWPLRGGLGFVAGGANTKSNVLFEVRADLIGAAIDLGHVTIELHLPSFRYAITNSHVPGILVDGVTTHWLSFFFGTTVSYAF